MVHVTGGCYCGAIRYEGDVENLDGVSCLCRTCQVMNTSASFNVKATPDGIKVTKGSPSIYTDDKADSGKPIKRYFCGNCATALWSDPTSMQNVRFLKAGALDNAKDVKLVAEIYVESALPHTVADQKKFGHKKFEGMMAKEVTA